MTRVATVPALARLKAQFARQDAARIVVHRGACGDEAGTAAVAIGVRAALGDGGSERLVESACDGACWAAPAATVQREGHSHRFARLDASSLPSDLLRCLEGECDDEYAGRGQYGLLERVGRNDGSLANVITRGAYAALAHAARLDPIRLTDALTAAGFTEFVRPPSAPPATSLVVDATDAAPGASRTRHLIEGDPHRLIEGILLACHASHLASAEVRLPSVAIGARDAFQTALAQAIEHGIVDGSAFGNQPVAIELTEGIPRDGTERAESGHQVEALSALTTAFDSPPTPTRLIALTGAVPRPGVYEVLLDGNTSWSSVLAAAGATPGLVPGVVLGAAATGAPSWVLLPEAYETPLSAALVGSGDATALERHADADEVAEALAEGRDAPAG